MFNPSLIRSQIFDFKALLFLSAYTFTYFYYISSYPLLQVFFINYTLSVNFIDHILDIYPYRVYDTSR